MFAQRHSHVLSAQRHVLIDMICEFDRETKVKKQKGIKSSDIFCLDRYCTCLGQEYLLQQSGADFYEP